MSDDEKTTPTPDPTPDPSPDPTPDPTPAAAPAPRRRLRDRLGGVRGLVAVGAATLILGGLGGFAVSELVGDRHDRPGTHDVGHDRPDDDDRWEHGPDGAGPVPPMTPEDGAPVQPDSGGSTSGSTS